MNGNDSEMFEIEDEDEVSRVHSSCMSGSGCFCRMRLNAANLTRSPARLSALEREDVPAGCGVLARLDDF